jgi:hypothetical protein
VTSIAIYLGKTDPASSEPDSLWQSCLAHAFPALQRDRDVAIFPDEVVEGAEVEFFSLLHAGFGQKSCDLEFADLIGVRCDLALRRGI